MICTQITAPYYRYEPKIYQRQC